MHTKTKSATSFRDFEHKANEVFEFGNDWGFYIDIESNSSLIDMSFIKNRIIYDNYVKTNKHIFRRKMECYNSQNKFTIKNSDEFYHNNKPVYTKNSFICEDDNDENYLNNKNKHNKSQQYRLLLVYKNMSRYIVRFVIRNSCTIVSFFVISYFMFKIRNK